jgi:hypothetical protein
MGRWRNILVQRAPACLGIAAELAYVACLMTILSLAALALYYTVS